MRILQEVNGIDEWDQIWMQLILVYSNLVIQLHKSVLWVLHSCYWPITITLQLYLVRSPSSCCRSFGDLPYYVLHTSLIYFKYIVLFKSSHNITLYRNMEMLYICSHNTYLLFYYYKCSVISVSLELYQRFKLCMCVHIYFGCYNLCNSLTKLCCA